MLDKPYNMFYSELRRIFGQRVQRISVDAGFSCPNRDGSIGVGGCIYCGSEGSGAAGIARTLSLTEQIEHGKEVIVAKYKAGKFLAYFQPYSNTYATPEKLRRLYDEALAVPDIVGLIVGTRPDCLPDDVIELLAQYSRSTYFLLEIGLQSSIDRTLNGINRGHDTACFVDAVHRCKSRGIMICAHLIFGLPGETTEEILSSAMLLNSLGIDGVKLHHLHILHGTRLEELYRQGGIRMLDRDDYVVLVCDFLERLDPKISIMRLVGDGGIDLVAPIWEKGKFGVLNAIDAEFKRRGTRQGVLC